MSLLSTLRNAVAADRNHSLETSLEPEAVYNVLRNKRRRCILYYLESHDDPVSVGDLADYLAEHYEEDRTAVYIASIQSHLPYMDEEGICEYQSDRKLVALTHRGRTVLYIHQVVSEILS